ncbi:hypothetical protein NA57DRAFT_79180 [Rhizodiscina lignyota]|uniref:DUF1772-domain-containing protein n=1 Tax=Rhizodiscina lignyota TaxID=1504668 RepID=A0A9P4M298_9PEZI|nr:hypothetical protein NA57DRAFT_79180 [Rhizodiscina lignyota]
MATISLKEVAQVVGIVSSGLFAGYTYSLSDAALPGILDASEDTMCRQWRYQYIRGFYVRTHAAVPATLTNLLSWGYLAYTAPDSFSRQLFVTAAVTTGSGTVFAWTALRGLNGALSIRSEKVLGPYSPSPNLPALTYSKNESWSKSVEGKSSTQELLRQWIKLNALRAGILALGSIVGAYGLIAQRP